MGVAGPARQELHAAVHLSLICFKAQRKSGISVLDRGLTWPIDFPRRLHTWPMMLYATRALLCLRTAALRRPVGNKQERQHDDDHSQAIGVQRALITHFISVL